MRVVGFGWRSFESGLILNQMLRNEADMPDLAGNGGQCATASLAFSATVALWNL